MERSQSCTDFDATNNNQNNTNRQSVIDRLQQQIVGSSDDIDSLYTNYTRIRKPGKCSAFLQRQSCTEIVDDEMYAADLEDLDEDEDDIETERTLVETAQKSQQHEPIATMPSYHSKHLQFQKHKPQSTSAILINSAATTSCYSSNTSYSVPTSIAGRQLKHEDSFDSTHTDLSPLLHRHNFEHNNCQLLKRDNSVQSDSSRYSSVDSLLESRKPDPEAILINLGFGPAVGSEDILSRIPKRFLKPSQVRGIDTEAFVRRLQLSSSLADHSVLGYRGLTGNPDIPPSSIVAKIMQRFEVIERKKSMGSIDHHTIR